MTFLLAMECLAMVVLLVCSALCSSAETALFSLNPVQVHRIRKSKPKAADQIEHMLAVPTHLLSSILIGNTVVNVLAAMLGFSVAESLFPSYGEAIAIPVVTLVLLIFGEVGPKRLAMAESEKIASLYAPALSVAIRIMTPLRIVLERSAKLIEAHLHPSTRTLTEDEFRTVVEVGEEEGVLDEEERTMVDGIIRLEETQASDVLTPRVDLIGIDLEDSPEENERVARSVQFRYLPVYRGSLDQAEGFLDVPRFLLAEEPNLGAAMIPPFFVPETAPLDNLLAMFQREGRRVAFVADEFGGTAGLITRGDILEEIAEDVDNEYGEDKFTIQEQSGNRWLVNGDTSLEDINYELDMHLEAEGADRIGGWVASEAEHIPRVGEVVEAQGCRATVQRVRKRRVMLVMLEKVQQPMRDSEDEE